MAGAGLALHGLSSGGDPWWPLEQSQTGHLEAQTLHFIADSQSHLFTMVGVLIGCTPDLVLPGLSHNGDVTKRSHFGFYGLILN